MNALAKKATQLKLQFIAKTIISSTPDSSFTEGIRSALWLVEQDAGTFLFKRSLKNHPLFNSLLVKIFRQTFKECECDRNA